MRILDSYRKFVIVVVVLLCFLCTTADCKRSGSSSSGSSQRKDPDDYYNALGLTKTATTKEIKSAYRKLALQFHPDKVPEEEKEASEEKFIKISEAYRVLGNDELKEVYDKYGKNGLDAFEKGQDPRMAGFGGGGFGGGGFSGGGGGGNPFAGFNFGGGGSGGFSGGNFKFSSSSGSRRGGPGADPFKMFEQFFKEGGFGDGAGGGKPKKSAAPDLFVKGESKVSKLGGPRFPSKSAVNMWFIMYYTNDNKGSQQAAPALKKLAEQSNLAYKVGAINCENSDREKRICKKISPDIDLPQFGLIIDGKAIKFDEDIHPNSLTAKDFHEFVQSNMPSQYIANINSVLQLEDKLLTVGQSTNSSVLLLTDKYDTSSMYYSIVYQFRNTFKFGESRAKNLKLAKKFNVEKYPQLIVFVPANIGEEPYNDEWGIIRYTGQLKKDAIIEWLKKIDVAVINASNTLSSDEKQEGSQKYEKFEGMFGHMLNNKNKDNNNNNKKQGEEGQCNSNSGRFARKA